MAPLHCRECCREVGEEVVDVLDADGEADGASADAGRGELGVVHLGVRGGRGVDDE